MELHRRSFSKRIDTGSEAQLHVENRNGAISVRAHDLPHVQVDATAEVYADSSRDADEQAARIERGISVHGSRVDIMTPDLPRPEWFFFGRGPKVDYQIRVPAATEVEAIDRNGNVVVIGVRGTVHGESRNGRVHIENVAGDINAMSRNGRIEVLSASGRAEVSGGNGHIYVTKVTGALTVRATNGSVDIADAGADVEAATTNGSIRFSGRVAGNVDLRATNGSLRMAVTPASRFELDAESRHGQVRSDIPVRDRPVASGNSSFRVVLRTTNGSIRLTEA